MQDITQGHTVHSYNDDLVKLRGVILKMGDFVLEQVSNGTKALCEADMELSRQVVDRDRAIDELDMEAEEDVLQIIALRQPQATDLRLVLALSKIASQLASAGNKAKKIAGFTANLLEDDDRLPRPRLLRDIRIMSDKASRMLEQSLAAVVEMDVPTAVAVAKADEDLDEEFDAAMRHLATFMLQDPSTIARILDMVFVLKALERIGDHANHIAEQVIFVAEGRDVRYVNKELLEAGSNP
jgi:phosphate transport system protein